MNSAPPTRCSMRSGIAPADRSRPAAEPRFSTRLERSCKFMKAINSKRLRRFVREDFKAAQALAVPSLARLCQWAARRALTYRWATTWSRPFLEADGHLARGVPLRRLHALLQRRIPRRVKIEQEWKSQYKRAAKASLLAKIRAESALLGGPRCAPVTILAFWDYGCRFCATADANLRELRRQYGDKVRIVYSFFPQNRHNGLPRSRRVPVRKPGSRADSQVHARLLKSQASLTGEDTIFRMMDELDLDVGRFKKDLKRSMGGATTRALSRSRNSVLSEPDLLHQWSKDRRRSAFRRVSGRHRLGAHHRPHSTRARAVAVAVARTRALNSRQARTGYRGAIRTPHGALIVCGAKDSGMVSFVRKTGHPTELSGFVDPNADRAPPASWSGTAERTAEFKADALSIGDSSSWAVGGSSLIEGSLGQQRRTWNPGLAQTTSPAVRTMHAPFRHGVSSNTASRAARATTAGSLRSRRVTAWPSLDLAWARPGGSADLHGNDAGAKLGTRR